VNLRAQRKPSLGPRLPVRFWGRLLAEQQRGLNLALSRISLTSAIVGILIIALRGFFTDGQARTFSYDLLIMSMVASSGAMAVSFLRSIISRSSTSPQNRSTPRFACSLLRALMLQEDFQALTGDLDEIYWRKCDGLGKKQADKWYRLQIISAILAFLRARASRLTRSRAPRT
jgi:hypothetical protein